MKRYLSMDLEATGIEEGVHLIQLAFIPIDATDRTIETDLGKEVLIQCPSFEELKPNLNEWVIRHNEELIRDAHAKGIPADSIGSWIENYLANPEVKAYFEKSTAVSNKDKGKVVFLGKSMSALDLPLLTRYLGRDFMQKYFHHHTLDITCLARALVDCGRLPEKCAGTSSLIKHFKIRKKVEHTALSDATDMAKIYFELLDLVSQS